MAQFPSTFVEALQLLPPDLGEVGNAARERLDEQNLYVGAGLPRAVAEVIAVEATHPVVQKYCLGDSEERFPNLNATTVWIQKHGGRAMWPLMEKNSSLDVPLIGWGWSGYASDDPEGDVTIAVRLGERGRNRRLASDYSRVIIAATIVVCNVDPERITLETWGSNRNANEAYKKVGFVEERRASGKRRTLEPVGGISLSDRVTQDEDGRRYRPDVRISMRLGELKDRSN